MLDDIRRSKEEHHFRKRDQELIARLRAKADEERRERESRHQKELHWMKCPKCGHDLHEVGMGPVVVDKCKECAGVYFDAGELDILLNLEQGDSVFTRLFRRRRQSERSGD